MSYNHFMVDIETTGTDAQHCGMIQLAAVAFDFDRMDISMEMFDQCLQVPGDRYWSEGTREFWSDHVPVLQRIWGRMRDPRDVLVEFNQWVSQQADGEEAVLWAKPSHFEWPFLESYYRRFELAIPFHYRRVEDLNSWCRARGLPDLSRQVAVPGDAHDAIIDVLHQVQVLFTLMESTETVVK